MILLIAVAFVLMPFLFWRASWFGLPMSAGEITQALAPDWATVDHDIVDGAPAARFTRRLQELIESGYSLDDLQPGSYQAPGSKEYVCSY